MAKRKKISCARVEKQIRAIQSLCKQKPGEKSVVQELLEERRAEREKQDREFIHSLRGKYKPKPGEKSCLEILMEERAKDKIREEEKIQRWLGGRQQRLV